MLGLRLAGIPSSQPEGSDGMGRSTLASEAIAVDSEGMNSDRIWGLVAVVIFAIMTITALTDFATSGWLLIPVIGAALYWIVRQAVAHGVKQH